MINIDLTQILIIITSAPPWIAIPLLFLCFAGFYVWTKGNK